jgi:hypothetical protein
MSQKLSLLLREVQDPYVQENFRKLKAYVETLSANSSSSSNTEVSSSSIAGEVTKIMTCAPNVSVEDLVYLDSKSANLAKKVSSNDTPGRVIGMVIKKLTPNRVEVKIYGIIDVDLPNGPVFVKENGEMKVGVPSSGGQTQRLGFSFGNGKMMLSPNRTRVRIN